MSNTITATIAVAQRLLAAFNGIDLSDDRGVEDAPARLIWLAVGIAIAIAATGFAIVMFNRAQVGVPDPVAPTP